MELPRLTISISIEDVSSTNLAVIFIEGFEAQQSVEY